MEYIGNCPKCNRHTIVKTIKRIAHGLTDRLPQRMAKCDKCGATARITIIGEILRLEKPTQSATVEFDPTLNSYSLKIQMWKK
jgi:hypothetical protein